MDFSEAFAPFQHRLRGLSRTEPLLWRLRDSLYNDLYYPLIGERTPKRHKFGYASWSISLFRRAVQGALQPPVMRESQPTNFGFLFYGSHDAHFATLLPVVREVAARQETTIWCMSLGKDQIQTLTGIDNVTCIDVGLWNERAGYSIVGNTIAAAIKAGRLQRKLAGWPDLLPEERDHVRSKRSQIAETIFDYFRWKRIWLSIFESFPKIALFVTSESAPIAKAFRDVMREADRRVVHFLHGLPNATHQVTYATDLCVYSASQADWFEQMVADVRIRAIGNPRLEQIRSLVSPAQRRQPGQPFRLLFFSQPTNDFYPRERRRTDLAILGSSPNTGDMVLRVRPHPTESPDLLAEDLKRVGIMSCEASTGSLIEDLTWCDGAATAFSTALLEAAACGRICYWIYSGAYPLLSMTQLCDQGIGKWIHNKSEWLHELDRIRKLQVAPPAIVTQDALTRAEILGVSGQTWLERLSLPCGDPARQSH